MKLEVTMKEMQELMNKKGQVEIMGKCYALNPQDELLIKFIMDFKERHETDYYDILSNAFNDVLMSESMMRNPYYQMVTNPMNMGYAQAPQISYNDMKNMYKKQFAQQLGLDIDGDEKHEDPTYNGCDCHVCDGNCEANIPDENKNGIDKDGKEDAKEDQVEYNPFAKAMMGDKVDLDDPKLKTMPKVETYQAKHPISHKKHQPKKSDEPKGIPVVTPEIIFKPKKKTDDETQKILSSKVMESDEDK